MNRKEMLSRLKAGYAPIDVSIEKWQDLKKKWVDMNGSVHHQTCALCEIYYKSGSSRCGTCPIVLSGQQSCGTFGSDSGYDQALYNEDASIMLDVLYDVKVWLDDEACKDRKIIPKKKERTYDTGNRFKEGDNEYILASINDNKVLMINLKDGCRWGNGVFADDIFKITKSELQEYFNDGFVLKED